MAPSGTIFTTLIGDLVGSRLVADRSGLQSSLFRALHDVNDRLQPRQPLEPTVGDEFQGCFPDVASAVEASLMLRLALLDADGVDSRYGIGQGAVTVFSATHWPRSQDGPGWWSARAAIDRSKSLSTVPRTSFARTCFMQWRDEERDDERWPDEGSDARGGEGAINAFLLCRDAIVGGMSPRARRHLHGLLLGRRQSLIAAEEGITQSAVSQSLASSGAFAIEAAQRSLAEGLA